MEAVSPVERVGSGTEIGKRGEKRTRAKGQENVFFLAGPVMHVQTMRPQHWEMSNDKYTGREPCPERGEKFPDASGDRESIVPETQRCQNRLICRVTVQVVCSEEGNNNLKHPLEEIVGVMCSKKGHVCGKTAHGKK